MSWGKRLLWLTGVMLAGCASLPPLGENCIAIGPRGSFCPLPPLVLPAVRAQHMVTVHHDGDSNRFLGRLQVNEQALRLAGASLFGPHLFTLVWDGQEVNLRPANADLRPGMMVAMLQLALADPAQLQPQLHGLELQVKRQGDGQTRTLSSHGRLVAQVERQGGPLASATLDIRVPPANLRLSLRPLRSQP